MRARTRQELLTALERREVDPDLAGEVVDRFVEVGLVDDVQFARDWVRSRQSRRHLSRRALRQELAHKGIAEDTIAEALADVDDDDEYLAALDLARTKARTSRGLDRQVRWRRLGGVLGRRGFSGSVVTRVLKEVLDDEE